MAFLGKWNLDAGRHSRERVPGPDYLRMSYYEKWLAGLKRLLCERGVVSEFELASGHAAPRGDTSVTLPTPEQMTAALFRGGSTLRAETSSPKFAIADPVRARNIHPAGHTRLPRYVRGHCGRVERHHGMHVFPDSNAHFRGECPQHLYTVRFTAPELWGESAAHDEVCVDLWESYLEPA